MKKNSLVLAIHVLLSVLSIKAQITQNCNGNIGIGGAPSNGISLMIHGGLNTNGGLFQPVNGGPGISVDSYSVHPYFDAIQIRPAANNYCRLGSPNYAFSDIYYYLEHKLSDERKKENITNISGALNKVIQMNGVKYDLKLENYLVDSIEFNSNIIEKIDKKRKNKLGFLAQDFEKVLPEVVEHDDSTDVYSIEYSAILPVLVEAIKEQQVIIESLQTEIKELKKQTGNESKLKSATILKNTTDVQVNSLGLPNTLYQNIPNPFSKATSIEYYITDNIQKAMICIYDMNGTQLKCTQLYLTGYGNITIDGSELKAGMYMYSLIVDGQLVDTKRMVLTD